MSTFDPVCWERGRVKRAYLSLSCRHPVDRGLSGAWLLVVLALAVVGCGEASTERECEPVSGDGCPSALECAVDPEGRPRCVTPGDGAEGDLCDDPAACAAGLGCVEVLGVARCVRFCAPGSADDPEPCARDQRGVGVARHPLSESARCVAALPVNDDIGVCLLPCHPATPVVDCPEGLTCGLSVVAGQGVCTSAGPASRGQSCGPDAACDVGLVCVPRGAEQVCRVPADLDGGCPDGTRATRVAEVRDPVRDADYAACEPCSVVGRFPIGEAKRRDPEDRRGVVHSVCHALVDADTAATRCSDEEGELARLIAVTSSTAAAIGASTGLHVQEDALLWTALRREDGRWLWPDRSELAGLSNPTGDGDCAALERGSGRLRALPCDAEAHPLCQLQQ